MLTAYIYIYFIDGEKIIFDRSVSRNGLGPSRAKQRVEELRNFNKEAFYTVGFTVKGALS